MLPMFEINFEDLGGGADANLTGFREALFFYFHRPSNEPIWLNLGPVTGKHNCSTIGGAMSNSSAHLASSARKFFPIFEWIATYRRDWLAPDVLAGLALWAVMVPEVWHMRALLVFHRSWGFTR